jgi:hypothetical protein
VTLRSTATQRQLAVAPLTCPPHVGSWAGLVTVGDLAVGDKATSRTRGPRLAAPPRGPSGSSPSVKKAALAAVSSFHWAGTSSS